MELLHRRARVFKGQAAAAGPEAVRQVEAARPEQAVVPAALGAPEPIRWPVVPGDRVILTARYRVRRVRAASLAAAAMVVMALSVAAATLAQAAAEVAAATSAAAAAVVVRAAAAARGPAAAAVQDRHI